MTFQLTASPDTVSRNNRLLGIRLAREAGWSDDMIRRAFMQVPTGRESRLSVAEIIDTCAAAARVSKLAMLSRRRSYNLSRPRQVAMYIACAHTDMSLPDIGRRCGDRDHSTVFHARNVVHDDLVDGGEKYGELVKLVEMKLGLR